LGEVVSYLRSGPLTIVFTIRAADSYA
jgi:hypothetical protein